MLFFYNFGSTVIIFQYFQKWKPFCFVYANTFHLSIKAPVCQWVSVFPNSSETANPSELKFWGMIPLGMEKVLG